jgi:hypothetical protein
MAVVANSAKNVSTGKGVAGGYFFSAPRTEAVLASLTGLADFATPLNEAFVNLGHISSDGIVIGESVTTNTDNDMNGDPINTSRSEREETVHVTLVERRAEALKEQYGQSNVTVVSGTSSAPDVATTIHNNDERDHRVYVAELVKKDGMRWRVIIPDGQITEIGDLTINSATLLGREATINCNAYTWTEGEGSSAVTKVGTIIDFEQLVPASA